MNRKEIIKKLYGKDYANCTIEESTSINKTLRLLKEKTKSLKCNFKNWLLKTLYKNDVIIQNTEKKIGGRIIIRNGVYMNDVQIILDETFEFVSPDDLINSKIKL